MKDFEIRCDKSHLEKNNSIYGKFTLGPFLPGQGTTFGNALRRSLLAELPGLAITAFEIVGVMQEFSTLAGLRESILDLSLNFKQIILTGVLPYSIPPIGFLNVRGPAIIKAIDLKLPAGVYCTSPDQYIATLGSSGILNIKFLVSVGKGYSIQPYSLYRSLSKIKLQPTLNFENTDITSFSSLQKKSNKTWDSYASRSNIEDSQSTFYPFPLKENGNKVENRIFVNPLDRLAVQNQFESEEKFKEKLNNSSSAFFSIPSNEFKENKKVISPESHNTSISSLSAPATQASSYPKEASPTEIPRRGKVPEKLYQEKKSIGNQSSVGYAKINTYSRGVDKDDFTLKENRYKTNTIESSFSNYINTATPLNASAYTNIQTQIFQRINPHQVLPIDAVFTPVSRVNFLIQINDRFETPRENIILEIWTNGSIHPKRALEEATLSLVQNFDTLLKKIQQSSSYYKGLRYWTYLQPSDSSNSTNGYEKKMKTIDSSNMKIFEESIVDKADSNTRLKKILLDKNRALYNLDIANLNFSLQTFILLKKAKIHTLSQLLTLFSFQNNKFVINSTKGQLLESEKTLFLNEKFIKELNSVVSNLN